MNILLFVTTMILVLSAMTYAKMESYRHVRFRQIAFKEFMQNEERREINEAASWWYLHAKNEREGGEKGTPATGGSKESKRRLSFALFLDKEKREKEPLLYREWSYLAKKMIYLLYAKEPFFKKMESSYPDIVDSLIQHLSQVEKLRKEERPKQPKDLANLEFEDPSLNLFLYFLLKGSPFQERVGWATSLTAREKLSTARDQGEVEDEESGQEGSRLAIARGSLLRAITLEEAKKIRVYLAPKELVMTLLHSPRDLELVLQTRNELYRQLLHEKLEAKEAAAQFEALIAPLIDKAVDRAHLDFTVTKTNPRNYD